VGLPIHRLNEFQKTYVYAYESELENWLKQKRQKNKRPSQLLHTHKKTILFTVILIFLAFSSL